MVSPKSLDDFKGIKIEFICFREYPPCRLTRQKRWPLVNLLLQKKKNFFGKWLLYIKRNILSHRASLYLAPRVRCYWYAAPFLIGLEHKLSTLIGAGADAAYNSSDLLSLFSLSFISFISLLSPSLPQYSHQKVQKLQKASKASISSRF